jgi:signal transduction histidine kinase
MGLEEALAAQGIAPVSAVTAGGGSEEDENYSQALNAAIRQVLHEITPIVGRARLAAQQQLGDALTGSRLDQELESLARVCDAFRRLAAASALPNPTEVDLAECLKSLAAAESDQTDISVRATGTSPFFVVVDRALLELAVVNLLRNAIEATEALESASGDRNPVVVNWGTHQGWNWVSVIDRGQGLLTEPEQLLDRGVSLRSGGRGYGLTTAVYAIRSLRGELEIGANEQGGTTASVRWPEGMEEA